MEFEDKVMFGCFMEAKCLRHIHEGAKEFSLPEICCYSNYSYLHQRLSSIVS